MRAGGVVLAVGVAVTVAALAACGGAADAGAGAGAGAGGDGKPPADPARAVAAVRAAADALTAAGSARVRTAMEMAAGGTRVTIRGEGGVDFVHRMGQLLVMLPADAAGKDEHRPITELLVPGALYMKNRGAGVPDDKWVRVDTATLGDGNLVTGGATDPLAAAELLRGAQEVTYVGETEVAGTRVWHYRGTTDLGRAARSASPDIRGTLEAAAKGFSKDSVPFDAYLDDEGRLRKVRHRFSYQNNGVIDVSSTTLLYGFGTPVTVALPPSGDIYAGKIAE
ncbi:lipoprotein [Streptomyces goshikiensis]|nr:lipoprotein [Streptomyces goshikiensis]